MEEYNLYGHMTKLQEFKDLNIGKPWNNSFNFLPHHGFREESETTQLRLEYVTEATDIGVSLNIIFMVGLKLQEVLFNILLKFKKHRVMINAAISKIYRQVLIR